MSALSDKEILVDAGKVVDDLVNGIPPDRPREEQLQILAEAGKIFTKASELIDIMVYGKDETRH